MLIWPKFCMSPEWNLEISCFCPVCLWQTKLSMTKTFQLLEIETSYLASRLNLSYETKVNDFELYTVLKIANLDFVATEAFVFHKHILFLNLQYFCSSIEWCSLNFKLTSQVHLYVFVLCFI